MKASLFRFSLGSNSASVPCHFAGICMRTMNASGTIEPQNLMPSIVSFVIKRIFLKREALHFCFRLACCYFFVALMRFINTASFTTGRLILKGWCWFFFIAMVVPPSVWKAGGFFNMKDKKYLTSILVIIAILIFAFVSSFKLKKINSFDSSFYELRTK